MNVSSVNDNGYSNEEDVKHPVIEIRNMSLKYSGKNILNNINLEIYPGEVTCILGASGSGKTSILRVIAGLERPYEGDIFLHQIQVNGKNLYVEPEKRGVGFVFQDHLLFPHLTVLENVTFGLKSSSTKHQERVLRLLKIFEVDNLKDQYPHNLSGGQQQRIAVVRALVPEPDIIVFDESFSGLDVPLKVKLRDHLLHYLKKERITTIFITHDWEEAMFMGDKIILLNEGSVVQYGRPLDLYYGPKSLAVAHLLGEVNVCSNLYTEGREVRTLWGSILLNEEFKNETCVHLLIRPEEFTLFEDKVENSIEVEIASSYPLGRTSLIHAEYIEKQKILYHFHIRVLGTFLPKISKIMYLRVLPKDMIFVKI